jgi:2-beta-glucuronyltransferase
MTSVAGARRALLFSQQSIGLGFRKTGMVYWAETLADSGWDVGMVTVQLSRVTSLLNPTRLRAFPAEAINRWCDRGPRRRGFVWVPPLHPMRLPPLLDAATALAARLYAASLPDAIRAEAARADLIVIESTAAVALFDVLRALAPQARIVYCASDRLVPNGMSRVLQAILDRTAAGYDLIRVPAASMVADFPKAANVHHIPHGVDRAAFAQQQPTPYAGPSRNLVVAGDGAYDPLATRHIAEALPDATVHLFGRMRRDSLGSTPNAVFHGEVPFATLVPFLQNADVGLAPYEDRPDRNYFAESSLRQLQYLLCGLPMVLPGFAAPQPQSWHFIYDAHSPETAGAAAAAALAHGRRPGNDAEALDWQQVVGRMLALAGAA